MNKITLANGAEYACDWAGAAQGYLNICLPGGMTEAQYTRIFGGPEATRRIEYRREGEPEDRTTIFEGYIILTGVQMDSWYGGEPIVSLKREG